MVQVYIKSENSVLPKTEKERKVLKKFYIKPGEKKAISSKQNEEAFQYCYDELYKWVTDPGNYNILVGNSSRCKKL